MKTNQTMSVSVFDGVLHIEHLTGYGSLTDVFTIGNQSRVVLGKKPAQLTSFLNSDRTKEYIEAAKQSWGLADLVYVKGKGNTKTTMAHISILIYAAEYLSSTFHAEVIKTFVQDRILEYRDESGDEFSILNRYIDQYLPGRDGKSNKGIYINVAKAIKSKVQPDGDSWNTASAYQLRKRYEIEKTLTDVLRLNVIRDWEDLKTVIERV